MALAIQPSKQYIKYEGDVDYWTNVAGIQIGDIVSVRGSKYNDGVYTVTGFVQYSSDHYMTVAGRAITDEVAFTEKEKDALLGFQETINTENEEIVELWRQAKKAEPVTVKVTEAKTVDAELEDDPIEVLSS